MCPPGRNTYWVPLPRANAYHPGFWKNGTFWEYSFFVTHVQPIWSVLHKRIHRSASTHKWEGVARDGTRLVDSLPPGRNGQGHSLQMSRTISLQVYFLLSQNGNPTGKPMGVFPMERNNYKKRLVCALTTGFLGAILRILQSISTSDRKICACEGVF